MRTVGATSASHNRIRRIRPYTDHPHRNQQLERHRLVQDQPQNKYYYSTTTTIKQELTRLDHRRDSEQVRIEKQVLLDQLRTKQTAGLKRVPLQNIEQEETEKLKMHPEGETGTYI